MVHGRGKSKVRFRTLTFLAAKLRLCAGWPQEVQSLFAQRAHQGLAASAVVTALQQHPPWTLG